MRGLPPLITWPILYLPMVLAGGVSMPTQQVIVSAPDVLGGTPVFVGTRVPVKNLLDYLAAGDSLAELLDDFPSVTREQAVQVLELAKEVLLAHATARAA